jgi:hypothetical protein
LQQPQPAIHIDSSVASGSQASLAMNQLQYQQLTGGLLPLTSTQSQHTAPEQYPNQQRDPRSLMQQRIHGGSSNPIHDTSRMPVASAANLNPAYLTQQRDIQVSTLAASRTPNAKLILISWDVAVDSKKANLAFPAFTTTPPLSDYLAGMHILFTCPIMTYTHYMI